MISEAERKAVESELDIYRNRLDVMDDLFDVTPPDEAGRTPKYIRILCNLRLVPA